MAEKRFTDESRAHIRMSSLEDLDNEKLIELVEYHKETQVPRLDLLDDYYEGDNVSIIEGERRQGNEEMADHRISHPFAEMITNFMQGYMVGTPVQTEYTEAQEGSEDALQMYIDELNNLNDESEHNSEIVADMSVYGRAYELVYRNQDDENRFALVSPLETFVIYDRTVESNPLAAVRYYLIEDDVEVIELYTPTNVIVYHNGDTLQEQSNTPHGWGGVPVIEYFNNRARMSDYEKVLNLIDAYDAVQSDTANYISDLPDSLLGIFGAVEGLDVETAKQMKQARMLLMKPAVNADGSEGKVDARYLYKEYDVAGSEAYKDRIMSDILMFTNTPNMQDTQFGGQQSGEAMKYKLFGLEQRRIAKVRLMTKGLRQRWRLISNMMAVSGGGQLDANKLNFKFTPNLPADLDKEVERLGKLGAVVSNETALSIAPNVVNSASDEQMRLERDQNKGLAYEVEE